jgi:peptidoglycan LD-endopeptidase CwlK
MQLISMDKISLDRAALMHPKVKDEVIALLAEAGKILTGRAIIRLSQTLRTFAEQAALYAQGRTKPGDVVTWANAGYSYHNYGLAFDIVLIIDGKEASWDRTKDYDGDGVADWTEFVKLAKSRGWAWGGDWTKKKDYPHFEKTFGYEEKTLLDKYQKKDFIPGTTYVNL